MITLLSLYNWHVEGFEIFLIFWNKSFLLLYFHHFMTIFIIWLKLTTYTFVNFSRFHTSPTIKLDLNFSHCDENFQYCSPVLPLSTPTKRNIISTPLYYASSNIILHDNVLANTTDPIVLNLSFTLLFWWRTWCFI